MSEKPDINPDRIVSRLCLGGPLDGYAVGWSANQQVILTDDPRFALGRVDVDEATGYLEVHMCDGEGEVFPVLIYPAVLRDQRQVDRAGIQLRRHRDAMRDTHKAWERPQEGPRLVMLVPRFPDAPEAEKNAEAGPCCPPERFPKQDVLSVDWPEEMMRRPARPTPDPDAGVFISADEIQFEPGTTIIKSAKRPTPLLTLNEVKIDYAEDPLGHGSIPLRAEFRGVVSGCVFAGADITYLLASRQGCHHDRLRMSFHRDRPMEIRCDRCFNKALSASIDLAKTHGVLPLGDLVLQVVNPSEGEVAPMPRPGVTM